ncbi:MAG: replicative DNA helicase [Parvularculaceae bacterium]
MALTSYAKADFRGDTDGEAPAPPHNLDAEQALLGAILFDNEAYFKVADFLRIEHFYDPAHQAIFEAIEKLIVTGRLASPITLKAYFEGDDRLAEIGGVEYLVDLAKMTPGVTSAHEYGRVIYEANLRRGLIDLGQDVVARAAAPDVDETPRRLVEETEAALYQLAETGRAEGGFKTFAQSLKGALDMANAAYERDGHLSGIATGLADVDKMMGGLHPSDLIIVAGRPSMGKSALATSIALNVARAYKAEKQPDGTNKTVDGGVVALFSLEMSSEQLATRILADVAEVSSDRIRRGVIDENEYERLFDAGRELESLPLHIDDTGGLSIAALSARCRRLKRRQGLDLIVVDYLQLLTSAQRRNDGRVQEVTEITQGLKALAKELNVPVIALAQLSRQVEQRDDKRPQLSDLRESGSIEQDADIVTFVYREEYYLARAEPDPGKPEHQEWQMRMDKVHGVAELIIGKQRHGPIGTVRLQFEERFTRFSNLDEHHSPTDYR